MSNFNAKLTLDEIKSIEINILSYVASLCEKHNLRYFLAYGTLIGAIRHKGFIPWDDDIDIAMPRDDYNRLLDIMRSEKGKYECLIPLENGFFYEFAKVIDTTTFVQEKNTIKARCGVWIDIFPLDGLKKNDKLTHFLLVLFNRCRAAAVNKKFPHKTKGIFIPVEYLFWIICRLIGYKPFLKWSIKLAQKYKYDDSDIVGYASSYPANNKYLKKEWFSESLKVYFEKLQFNIPIGYHEYLTTQYGDYMQLPAENKRVSHHMEAYKI